MYFVYEAVGRSGRPIKGSISAPSLVQLRKDLQERGLALVDVRRDVLGEFREGLNSKKLDRTTLIDFCGYIHGLMAMGLDINAILKVLAETLTDKKAKPAVETMSDAIKKGFPLGIAMEQTQAFPQLVIGSVKAGEMSGNLEKVFRALEEHFRAERELAGQVAKSTLYPAITFVVLFGVMIGLLTFVVPQLEPIFPKNPPLPTKVLMLFSHGAIHGLWLGPLLATLSWFSWKKMPDATKARIWEAFYGVPMIGALLKNLALTNVFFNFSLMMGAGVSVTQALDTIIPTITSRAVTIRLKKVRTTIANGGMLADAFYDPFFPPIVASSIKQGETTGHLDNYCARLAVFLRDRAKSTLETLATFIEPAMLVIGGGMLLFFAMGIFMPLYGNLRNMK